MPWNATAYSAPCAEHAAVQGHVLCKEMRQYRHISDAALGMILLVVATPCILIILATVVCQIAGCTVPGYEAPTLWPTHLPFVGMLVGVFITRHHLFGGRVPTWSYLLLLGVTGIAFWFSFVWFEDPMHDIALFFGSHGRWGCGVVNGGGSSPYLIRDDTVPWMLFAPVGLAILGHWIRSKTRQAQNNNFDPTTHSARCAL